MNDEINISIDGSACKEKRQQRNLFYQSVASCRPTLFKFCRRLTRSPWDAEDLVQETLMIAYGRLADKHAGILNLQAYLFKIATNQWISWCRRHKLNAETALSVEPKYENDFFAVHDSLGMLASHLPPKERVAFVLSEVFDSKNEEIAEVLGNTEGAVKAALVRAREKVKLLKTNPAAEKKRLSPSSVNSVFQRAVDAFNRRDIEGFAKLFSEHAVANGPGCFFETGIEEIKKGSLFYTINNYDGKPQPPSMRAETIQMGDDTLFAIFNNDALDDVWRFTVDDGMIMQFDCYYCCPDVLAEIANLLKKSVNDHGYWFEQRQGTS